MNNYLILLIGMVLGQLCSTAVIVYNLQKKKNINYWPAAKAYVISEQGSYIIAFLILLVVMFVLPEIYMQPTDNVHLSPSVLQWRDKITTYLRTSSFLFGLFAPLIFLMLYKKGVKAIEAADAKISS